MREPRETDPRRFPCLRSLQAASVPRNRVDGLARTTLPARALQRTSGQVLPVGLVVIETELKQAALIPTCPPSRLLARTQHPGKFLGQPVEAPQDAWPTLYQNSLSFHSPNPQRSAS